MDEEVVVVVVVVVVVGGVEGLELPLGPWTNLGRFFVEAPMVVGDWLLDGEGGEELLS